MVAHLITYSFFKNIVSKLTNMLNIARNLSLYYLTKKYKKNTKIKRTKEDLTVLIL